jgi:hypothetical protein
MKQIFLLLFAFSSWSANAQTDSAYQVLVAKANLPHLQKYQKKALGYFEQAFAFRKPDPLNAYKAAGVYSLDSNAAKAFYYLQAALDSGWTEADWLSFDPYFDYLRKMHAAEWKAMEQQAFEKEKKFTQTLTLPALRKEINLLALQDQKLRYEWAHARTKIEQRQTSRLMQQADSQNLARSKEIFRQYGFPGISAIGKDGQNNFWLIIQHADQDVLYQQEVLADMKTKHGTDEISHVCYAFLYDRVQCNLNYKQTYGTQVKWSMFGEASGFRSISEEDQADQRRKELGLAPLSVYSLTYGFTYTPVTALQAKQQDSADLAYTRQVIDSAGYYYNKKKFQEVYDLYNTASTVMGGMSSGDNYAAAVLFAKISAQDKDPQYKGIALDFLNLLYLRKELNRHQLDTQKEFSVLVEEPRWKEMILQLK